MKLGIIRRMLLHATSLNGTSSSGISLGGHVHLSEVSSQLMYTNVYEDFSPRQMYLEFYLIGIPTLDL